jgi:hypothetical protein
MEIAISEQIIILDGTLNVLELQQNVVNQINKVKKLK